MGCSCNKKREQFEVVTPNGKVVFTSASRPTADAVAKRYPGSSVRPTGAKTATAAITLQPSGATKETPTARTGTAPPTPA